MGVLLPEVESVVAFDFALGERLDQHDVVDRSVGRSSPPEASQQGSLQRVPAGASAVFLEVFDVHQALGVGCQPVLVLKVKDLGLSLQQFDKQLDRVAGVAAGEDPVVLPALAGQVGSGGHVSS